MATDVPLRVLVAYSPGPRDVQEVPLAMPGGADVAQAIQASGLTERFAELDLANIVVGVWGRKVGLHHPLRDRDRVEIYRPLTVDPKVARRARFVKQGSRGTGLFAKKRVGGKPGY